MCYGGIYRQGMPTSGMDLTVARVRAKLSKTAVAKQMGTTRQTLWVEERAEAVDPDFARRFLLAVDELRNAKETAKEAAA